MYKVPSLCYKMWYISHKCTQYKMTKTYLGLVIGITVDEENDEIKYI